MEDKPTLPTPPAGDKSAPRKDALERQMISRRQHKAGGGVMGGGELPETLIPKEFHLVQSKAALGLEYNKE